MLSIALLVMDALGTCSASCMLLWQFMPCRHVDSPYTIATTTYSSTSVKTTNISHCDGLAHLVQRVKDFGTSACVRVYMEGVLEDLATACLSMDADQHLEFNFLGHNPPAGVPATFTELQQHLVQEPEDRFRWTEERMTVKWPLLGLAMHHPNGKGAAECTVVDAPDVWMNEEKFRSVASGA